MTEKNIALLIPDFDYGGEETRVVFFANNYLNYFSNVFLISPDGESSKALDSRVNHIKLNIRNIANIPRIFTILKKYKIGILQGHKRITLPYLYLTEKILGTKSFFNFDNIYPTGNMLCSYISPTRLVYLSDVLKEFYLPFYRKSFNTTINMGGFFLTKIGKKERELLRNEFGITNEFVLLSLGRLSQQKNHILLINALELIQQENIICLIAGEGPLENELKNLVKLKGLDSKVRFLGHRTDIENLLNISDVLIQTSKFEGFPNVFIEATSAGLPIIATDVGSAKSLIKENGILVRNHKNDEISKAIEKMMLDKEFYRQKAEELMASEYFNSFSRENMLNNYVSYIKQL